MELAQSIKTKALEIGFDLVGITTADPVPKNHIQALKQWIEKGHVAGLEYMKKNTDKRLDPTRLLENAKSVICLALHYKPAQDVPRNRTAKIANFALYEDYHSFLKDRIYRLAKFIETRLPADFSWRFQACVDTAPIAERALAARAGLGCIGKNHMLTHPVLGNQLLLGELVTTLTLPPDQPVMNSACRGCNECIRACPTGALQEDGSFHTRRCISYLTQYDGEISEFADAIGNRLYGCDACLLACPLEQNAPPCKNKEFQLFPDRILLTPSVILTWDQKKFKEQFQHSCIQEIGLEKLQENARICAKNIG